MMRPPKRLEVLPVSSVSGGLGSRASSDTQGEEGGASGENGCDDDAADRRW